MNLKAVGRCYTKIFSPVTPLHLQVQQHIGWRVTRELNGYQTILDAAANEFIVAIEPMSLVPSVDERCAGEHLHLVRPEHASC